MMVFLHTLMRWVDKGAVIDSIGSQELFVVFILVSAVFFGAWAGFFLLVSAVGNMISMQKSLERGADATGLAIKQIFGGFILLMFAFLSESAIGYHGALGEIALHGSSYIESGAAYEVFINRWAHFETIHAVAVCVIINGAVQAILARNGGWKNYKKKIRIYAILAVIVVVLTIPAWELGMPFGDPVIGEHNIFQVVYLFLLNILDRAPEPIFPFLAVSFIGSIIGIWMCDPDRDSGFVKRTLKRCIIWFWVGLALTLAVAFENGRAFDELIDHSWTIRDFYNIPEDAFFGVGKYIFWLGWFVCLTAAQVAAVILVLRLVEFRGRGQWFASKTKYFRRYGLVAFTIYNYEFFDIPFVLLYCWITGTDYHAGNVTFGVWEIWIIIIGVFISWQIILKLWEKVGYVFGLEWMIAKLADLFFTPPKKAESKKEKEPWWYSARLDADIMLKNIQALNFRESSEVNHEQLEDSKVALKLSYLGLLFFPLAFAGFAISNEAEAVEKPNEYLKKAKLLSRIGILLTLAVIAVGMFVSLDMLGLGGLL